jgi:glycosyltransferase involved in cell wall biosynthesis
MSEIKSSEAGQPQISIVVPVYNEEDNVNLLYQRIHDACEPIGQRYEVVFVDDGSRDRTFEVLSGIHEQDPRVKVVRFRRNYGQTAAMAAGFEYAQGRIMISMDGDLQNDPSDIPLLLAKLDEGYDVVCGWRKNRQDKMISRRFPSVIANWIIGRVTGVRIHDNGCSLKAYRGFVIKNVALYGETHRFIPAMSTLTGARIAEIVVNHHARRFGKSKYGIGRVWRVMLDIITVKMLAGFAARPALWFGILSLPFLFGGLFALSWASLQFLGIRSDKWITTSTTAFLFLFLAGHLLSLAVIGELLLKTGDYSPKGTLDPTIKEL